MHLTHLQGTNLRCFSEFSLTPVSGVNLITGANGAGKTSILEAIHILGYGRSFRSRIRDALINNQSNQLHIHARWLDSHTNEHQAGLQHSGNAWKARIDQQDVANLGEFCAHFPVISFEPGSHELINGNADNRRRFMDWGLFHVEHGFLPVWRRFNRALKQRNALLKNNPDSQELEPWDFELAEVGEQLTDYRKNYVQHLNTYLPKLLEQLIPECGELHSTYLSGWKDAQLSLFDSLRLNRNRDIQVGFTTLGAHRSDWLLSTHDQRSALHFSRGQAKLIALACLLAQAHCFFNDKGYWPILCFDDLASELDAPHFEKLLQLLNQFNAQIWISGTDVLPVYEKHFKALNVFHVEHGTVLAP